MPTRIRIKVSREVVVTHGVECKDSILPIHEGLVIACSSIIALGPDSETHTIWLDEDSVHLAHFQLKPDEYEELMDYDVFAQVKADIALCVPAAETPEVAAAVATGGMAKADRDKVAADLREAVTAAVTQVLERHYLPLRKPVSVDFALLSVAWGDDGGEYTDSAETAGVCEGCGAVILNRDIPAYPYTYGCASEHGGLLCYPCHQKQTTEQTPT